MRLLPSSGLDENHNRRVIVIMVPVSRVINNGEVSDGLENGSDDFSDVDDDDLTTEEEEGDDDDDDGSEPWIGKFVSSKGHDFFVAVDEEYIRDEFNIQGLRWTGPKDCQLHFDSALDIILDNDDSVEVANTAIADVRRAAIVFYGLIHSRFILTPKGLHLMSQKYKAKVFGICPNALCNSQPMLPLGVSDLFGENTVKAFCPRCNEIYHPAPLYRRLGIDGAFFGSAFAHLFCLVFESMVPQKNDILGIYVPRIYGFKVHSSFKERLRAKEKDALRAAAVKPSQSLPIATAKSNDVQEATGGGGEKKKGLLGLRSLG